MKKVATKVALFAALPIAGLVLASPALGAPPPPPKPHPVQQLLQAGNNALVGVVGQTEATINGTLYNLGFRPYI
jgi:hypothetical protein